MFETIIKRAELEGLKFNPTVDEIEELKKNGYTVVNGIVTKINSSYAMPKLRYKMVDAVVVDMKEGSGKAEKLTFLTIRKGTKTVVEGINTSILGNIAIGCSITFDAFHKEVGLYQDNRTGKEYTVKTDFDCIENVIVDSTSKLSMVAKAEAIGKYQAADQFISEIGEERAKLLASFGVFGR